MSAVLSYLVSSTLLPCHQYSPTLSAVLSYLVSSTLLPCQQYSPTLSSVLSYLVSSTLLPCQQYSPILSAVLSFQDHLDRKHKLCTILPTLRSNTSTGAPNMLLHIDGKFTMENLMSSLLSWSFVLNKSSLSSNMCTSRYEADLAVYMVSVISSPSKWNRWDQHGIIHWKVIICIVNQVIIWSG